MSKAKNRTVFKLIALALAELGSAQLKLVYILFHDEKMQFIITTIFSRDRTTQKL